MKVDLQNHTKADRVMCPHCCTYGMEKLKVLPESKYCTQCGKEIASTYAEVLADKN